MPCTPIGTPPLTGPYTEHDPFHDPFVMFAYLAGITERIRFATGILVLPQRQTALVARQAADVDLLSGGRLRLGVGVGWNHVEYEALGQDFHTRGARQEEQIELLRRLFTEPVVDFSGRFDRVDRAALVPKPTAPSHLARWIEREGLRPGGPAGGRLHLHGRRHRQIHRHLGRLRQRVADHGRSVDDFGGGLSWRGSGGDVDRLTGGDRSLGRGRWDPRLGGHHGPRTGLRRCPHRPAHRPGRGVQPVVTEIEPDPALQRRPGVQISEATRSPLATAPSMNPWKSIEVCSPAKWMFPSRSPSIPLNPVY